MGLFSFDGVLFRLCQWIYRCVAASILFLVCCILVITIPASAVALYSVFADAKERESQSIVRLFVRGLTKKFRQSLWIGLLFLLFGCFLVVDYVTVPRIHSPLDAWILGTLWVVSLLWGVMLLQVFPLLARYDLSTGRLFVFAFQLSFYRFPLTLVNLLVLVLGLEVTLHLPTLFGILYPGAAASLTMSLMDRKLHRLLGRVGERRETRD